MINNELLEEVIEVSLNGEIIDQDLLIKIIDNVISNCEESTKSKFNGIEIFKECKKQKKINAEYIDEYKIINIFYLNIVKNGLLRKKLNVFQTNLYMIQVILHEIEHLKSDTIELKDDFESKLLKNSSSNFIWQLIEDNLNNFFWKHKNFKIVEKYLVYKYQKFYLPIWKLCPDEKMAEVYSTKILLDDFTNYHNFSKNYSDEYEYLKKHYLKSLLMGYYYEKNTNIYNIPLLDYMDEISKIDILERMDPTLREEIKNIEKYSLEERMKYGLPIEKQDLEEVKKKIFTRSTI